MKELANAEACLVKLHSEIICPPRLSVLSPGVAGIRSIFQLQNPPPEVYQDMFTEILRLHKWTCKAVFQDERIRISFLEPQMGIGHDTRVAPLEYSQRDLMYVSGP